MSVSATVELKITAVEELLAAAIPTVSSTNASGSRVTHSEFNTSQRLSGTTTAKVDAVAFGVLTTDGADTIDLTSVATALDTTTDMTGKKVVAAIFRCPDDNAALMNVAPGASNAYALFGTGNDIDIRPGQRIAFTFVDVASPLATVSGSAKNIDVTGTSGDVLEFILLLGTP